MAVHVGEIHTELTTRSPAPQHAVGGAPGASEPRHPGAGEDQWRDNESRVLRQRRRTCAEDSDD